jgi:hypothetical protein
VIFAAGYRKAAYGTSKIGVHGAGEFNAQRDGYAKENDGDMATTLIMARTMASFDVPDNIIVKMIGQPANGMVWLSRADVTAWGVEILK